MTLPRDILGVDVAKDWIDVFTLAAGSRQRIPATPAALARFAEPPPAPWSSSRRRADTSGVRRGAGPGRDPLRPGEPAAGPGFRPGDRQVAKTDRVDAEVLARMGGALDLAPTPPEEPVGVRLADLLARRDDLLGMIWAEKNRAAVARDTWIARGIARIVKVLERHLAGLGAEIAVLLAACGGARRGGSAPALGPGRRAAGLATLVARLPELGRLDHRRIAAWWGSRPMGATAASSEAGAGSGAGPEVRRALYVAAFVASRRDPRLRRSASAWRRPESPSRSRSSPAPESS